MKKAVCLFTVVLLAVFFSGCGTAGEKTAGAMQLIGALDYQGALAQLDSAEEDGENDRLVNRARGIAYMGLTDYGRAAECFEAAIAGSNGIVEEIDYDLNLYLAAAYTKDGRYSEAEEIYHAVLAMRPGQEDVYFLRGNVRLAQGNHEGAKADFDTVIGMNPANYDRLVEIYEVLDYCGYSEEARNYLRAALASDTKGMSKSVIGRIYYYLGEYQSAAFALEEARGTGGMDSFLYLGRAYEATGDYNYAANVYYSYLGKGEGNAELYNQLGLCEMMRGEYQSALEAFQAGLQLEDTYMMQTLSFNEIVAYEHLGEFEQARVLMGKYLQNYSDDERAKREYDFLSTR